MKKIPLVFAFAALSATASAQLIAARVNHAPGANPISGGNGGAYILGSPTTDLFWDETNNSEFVVNFDASQGKYIHFSFANSGMLLQDNTESDYQVFCNADSYLNLNFFGITAPIYESSVKQMSVESYGTLASSSYTLNGWTNVTVFLGDSLSGAQQLMFSAWQKDGVSGDPSNLPASGNGSAHTQYDKIYGAIALDQVTIDNVPEPSVAILASLGSIALLRRRRN